MKTKERLLGESPKRPAAGPERLAIEALLLYERAFLLSPNRKTNRRTALIATGAIAAVSTGGYLALRLLPNQKLVTATVDIRATPTYPAESLAENELFLGGGDMHFWPNLGIANNTGSRIIFRLRKDVVKKLIEQPELSPIYRGNTLRAIHFVDLPIRNRSELISAADYIVSERPRFRRNYIVGHGSLPSATVEKAISVPDELEQTVGNNPTAHPEVIRLGLSVNLSIALVGKLLETDSEANTTQESRRALPANLINIIDRRFPIVVEQLRR